MDLVVDVPLNTVLADVDESLRDLLKFELEKHGFDGVEIAFDAPSNDWSSQLSQPTVNLFLYDLRESMERRQRQFDVRKHEGRTFEAKPPMMVECSYAVTAWTKEVQDEHRLLSQVLSVLHAYPTLPKDMIPKLANGTSFPLETTVAMPKSDEKADFWTAIRGQYKVSLDYVVVISIASASAMERGPEVLTHTVRSRDKDGPTSTISELHGIGGTVTGPDDELIPNVWVVLPKLGLWTATDQNGYYVFKRVPAGTHEYHLRAPDGSTSEGELTVPGKETHITIGRKVEVTRR